MFIKFKTILLVVFIVNFLTCLGTNIQNSFVGQRFIHNESFKDRNYELEFHSDSILVLRDSFGCNQFYQKAKYIVFDSTTIVIEKKSNVGKFITFGRQKIQTYDEGHNMVLSTDSVYLSNDTLQFISQDSIKVGQFVFFKSLENVSDLSINELEQFLIENIGYDKYVNDFGKGDINEARRKLIECR